MRMFTDPRYELFQPVLTADGWERGFAQQHFADAYIAEFAEPATPPVSLAFALVGLHLKVDHGLSGRDIQQVHAVLARRHDAVPMLTPAHEEITFGLEQAAQLATREALDAWCAAVWASYRDQHDDVRRYYGS